MIRSVFVIAAATLVALPAFAGPLQDSILAHAETLPEAAFAFTQSAELTSVNKDGEKEVKTFTLRFDPRKPEKQRWQLVSIDGRTPTDKERKNAEKHARNGPIPGYHRIARWIGAPAAETPTQITYDKFPKKTFDMGPMDLSKKLAGTAYVSTTGDMPWVERSQFRLTEPARAMLVAKIEDMQVETRFKRLGDGTPVLATQTISMAGSMLGKSGRQTTRSTYSDYVRVN